MLLKCETLAISRGLYLSMEMHATPRKARKVGIKRTNTTELQFLQVVRYQVQRKKEECFRFLFFNVYKRRESKQIIGRVAEHEAGTYCSNRFLYVKCFLLAKNNDKKKKKKLL